MTRTINTYISFGLYQELRKERDMLRLKEKIKRGRKRRITLIDASHSIVRKLLQYHNHKINPTKVRGFQKKI